VPQWQKSKGSVIMTAALELSTNQVDGLKNSDLSTIWGLARRLRTCRLPWNGFRRGFCGGTPLDPTRFALLLNSAG
jgi:hypothetical protein